MSRSKKTRHQRLCASVTRLIELMPGVKQLIAYLRISSPSVRVVRLAKKDLDLIRRWPLAAGAHGIYVSEATRDISYDGYELLAVGQVGRYGPKPVAPVQEQIV